MIGLPTFGPYFVTSSTGGVTTSPVSGFLTPGLPGTSVLLSTVHLDQIHLYDLVVFVHHNEQSLHWLFCYFSVGSPSPTFSPVNGFLVVGVVMLFLVKPFCFSLYLAL